MMIRRFLLAALALLMLATPASAAIHVGDFPTSATVICLYNTNDQTGASITRSTDGTLKIFKNTSATERTSLAGVTQTEDFDSATGVHAISIDTSDNTDAGFYAAGNEYHVVNTGMVIDTKTVNAHLCSFSIERSGGILALIKARLPNATPGAAGGVFIAGTNAATTITTAGGAALTLSATGANGQGLLISGNGSGAGVQSTGGATGAALKLIGGGTSGEGLLINTTSGDGIKSAPTAGDGLNLAANGTSKHGLRSVGGTAGTSHGALFTAGTGGNDLKASSGITVDACTGCSTVAGTTIMPVAAFLKDSTSVIVDLWIKDTSTNLGKTGLTNASVGLTLSYCRVDQGNANCSAISPAAATRGAYTSGGFVEKDATKAPGMYEIGLPTAVLATGADWVDVWYSGVSGTSPTKLRIELVDTGLTAIYSRIGAPAGASVSADVASVKLDTSTTVAKTNQLVFTGGNVNANMQASAGTQTFDLTGNITGNLSGSVGSVTGAVGSVTGAVGSVTGAVGSVTGAVGSVAAGGIAASSFAAGAIDATAIAADAIGSSELAATAVTEIVTGVSTTYPTNFAATAINGNGLVSAGGTYRKNLAGQTFPIYMVNAAGAGKTGETVAVKVSKDGAGGAAITGTVAEIDAVNLPGWYLISFSQADTNCDMCVYNATSAGTVNRPFYFKTAP